METIQNKKMIELSRQVLENDLGLANHDLTPYQIEPFLQKGGVFITLNKNGSLRGCIGRIESDLPLYQNVIDLTRAAAFEDHRFPPLTASELKDITIEISILSPPSEVLGASTLEKMERIRPDIDGVVLSAQGRKATFLPQVWESIPIKEDFLCDLCRKAGLPPDYWKTNEVSISVYQAEKIKETKTA